MVALLVSKAGVLHGKFKHGTGENRSIKSYSSHTKGDKMTELLGSKVEVLQNRSDTGENRSVGGDGGRQTDKTAGE